MCGILGYSSAGALPDLGPALRALAHRGPDGNGASVFPEIGIGLAHTRLAIIDLSPCGSQPMTSASGRLTISYNGELYNYRELREELERAGVKFRGRSDTEVLLELLDREGLDCLPRLNGIFAFAVADHRAGSVTLVRDRWGVKPLYFSRDKECVRFASEVKALIALGAAPGDPDPVALARYLSFLWNPGETMPTDGIRRLGPGKALSLEAGSFTREWSWCAPRIFTARKSQAPAGRLIEELRIRLRTAVERQLVADVPVGTFLSGGLDSSLITALARESVQRLQCFTIEAPGADKEGATDDLPYARQVANHLGVELEIVSATPENSIEVLKTLVHALDEPLADPAAINVGFIAGLARSKGIKVLLSGSGGDDLFTGYRRHVGARMQPLWNWVPLALRRPLARSSRVMDRRNPLARRAAKMLGNVDLDGDEALIGYFRWTGRSDVARLFRADYRRAVEAVDPAQPMLDHLAGYEGEDAIDRMLALEQRFFLCDHNLVYTDKMSMAHGVEVRVPFLDNELGDFAATIPSRLLQRGREGKWILKMAAEPFLPRNVIYRPKTGFGVPLRHWMRHELRTFVEDNLSPDRLRARGIFDPAAVHSLIRRNLKGQVDASYTILSLLCIELWFQAFADGVRSRKKAPREALGERHGLGRVTA